MVSFPWVTTPSSAPENPLGVGRSEDLASSRERIFGSSSRTMTRGERLVTVGE
jgi:hypothetical protein